MISFARSDACHGRAKVARSVLETFGAYLSEGMLPNFFPDSGQVLSTILRMRRSGGLRRCCDIIAKPLIRSL